MQSIKTPYTTHHCDLYALVGWPSRHTRHQPHWLQVIYKSMLGQAPPYLSSLVTMATPTRSTRSSRYISLVIPRANTSFPSSSLLPMTGKDCKNRWSWRLISSSLTLIISYQSSLPITEAVHSPSVNSPSNYLPHPHIVFVYFFLLFCTPVFLLAHHHLHIYHSSVNFLNCNYFATMAYLLPYLLTPFAHTVYRFFYCVIDCTFVYPMCNCVVFVALLCFILARSQL